MAQQNGLNRRTFLKSAGMTAVAGAVGSGTSLSVVSAVSAVSAASAAAGTLAAGTFDFDTPYSRIGTDCTKWDRQIALYGKDKIAVGMGIADMDFKAAPCITQALVARLQHENWGYLTTPASHVESIVNWNHRRYGLEIKPEWILHSPSVHPAILSALRAFSPPGSKVIVQSPVYNAFYSDITNVGCKAEESPLKLVDGHYSMDFEDLERRIAHDTNTLILCNPHNPTGNVWSRQDLTTLGEICTRRRVVVLADEIHCDFVMKDHRYTPYASLQDEKIVMNSVTFKSASKSFNLAAMKCGYMFSPNPEYIARIKAVGHREDLTTLGMVANRAAYNEGAEWLDQLLPYIDANHDFVASFVSANIPLVRYVKAQGTYLAWLDVSPLAEKIGAKTLAAEATRKQRPSDAPVTPETIVERYLVEHAKVHMNAGHTYGNGGAGRMRMNIGTSRKTLELALTNMASALKHA
ncbi:MAG TPA: PatB family C-S lyase [Vicinamibacterales bacterium]|jgi:cystathionine beta-lyase|nr:PatB family C-S lyase [Vicinamibacterales bacterium]